MQSLEIIWHALVRFVRELFDDQMMNSITEIVVDRAILLLRQTQHSIEAA